MSDQQVRADIEHLLSTVCFTNSDCGHRCRCRDCIFRLCRRRCLGTAPVQFELVQAPPEVIIRLWKLPVASGLGNQTSCARNLPFDCERGRRVVGHSAGQLNLNFLSLESQLTSSCLCHWQITTIIITEKIPRSGILLPKDQPERSLLNIIILHSLSALPWVRYWISWMA